MIEAEVHRNGQLLLQRTYHEPSLSLETVLKQLELCRQLDLRYLYLGLYIAACAPMAYKARFIPHERLVDGTWREHREP